MHPTFNIKYTKCIIHKGTHSMNKWGRPRFVTWQQLKLIGFETTEEGGFVCNKIFMRIRKQTEMQNQEEPETYDTIEVLALYYIVFFL